MAALGINVVCGSCLAPRTFTDACVEFASWLEISPGKHTISFGSGGRDDMAAIDSPDEVGHAAADVDFGGSVIDCNNPGGGGGTVVDGSNCERLAGRPTRSGIGKESRAVISIGGGGGIVESSWCKGGASLSSADVSPSGSALLT